MIEGLQVLRREDGVQLLTEPDPSFERAYLEARGREGWLYDDDAVRRLPYSNAGDRHASLWQLRLQSFHRFMHYVRALEYQPLNVLEIGCGNGWFSHAIVEHSRAARVVGLDVNLYELKQAARVFGSSNPAWCNGDVFKATLPAARFHLIVFNSAVQYFPNLTALLDRVLGLLAPTGEVHILDSPFYRTGARLDAQRRTAAYYRQLDVEEMTAYYHAHTFESLAPVRPEVLYDPRSLPNRLRKMAGAPVNPFPWIRVRR